MFVPEQVPEEEEGRAGGGRVGVGCQEQKKGKKKTADFSFC